MSRGRPRDPEIHGRVIKVATTILAVNGMAGFTAEEVANSAGIGKASLYRRWAHLPDLLVDIVADLGVRPEDLSFDDWTTATLRNDLYRLLAAATTGPRATAEVAVLPSVGRDERLRTAHTSGPLVRLLQAVTTVTARARMRGDVVPTYADSVVVAGVAWLQQRMAIAGRQAQQAWIEDALDFVVLPALTRQPVAS